MGADFANGGSSGGSGAWSALGSLPLLDYGARMFVLRGFPTFTSPDPLSEKYFGLGNYVYVANSPINHVDINGLYIGDPVMDPQIRRNRASNLYGENIRRDPDGTLKTHQGFDYYAPKGTPVMSVQDGKVVDVSKGHVSYGTSVTVQHADAKDGTKRYSFYAHLSEASVEVGTDVKEGDEIAKSGTTGNAAGQGAKDQHLHFELRTQKTGVKGLAGKLNPNEIVDTKFESQNPDVKPQSETGIIMTQPNEEPKKLNPDLK